ncbi:MAG: lipopolysaccharide heptosyltransferase II [Chlamydiae bacterium]|nr:lipopolysaccharide heptosyltransferase II [Chlamydiota bacterium]
MGDLTNPKNIIVRMPNWVGDMVMATPIISDLRKAFPDAKITAMCKNPLSELLEEDQEIDEVFCFNKTSLFSRHSDRRNILDKLQKGKYDLGILLTNSISTAWWFWQGKVENRIGFNTKGRSYFLTHPVEFPENIKKQHLVTTYKKLLEPLGIPISDTSPRIFVSDKEIQLVRALLKQHGVSEDKIIVGINPGATYGSAKCWLPERFRGITKQLLEDKDVFVVYFGDLATASLVKEICQGLSQRVINMAGLTSLRELAALLKICDVLLTNDSGPMHIAAALGTPVVALFGSTSPEITGPFRTGVVVQKPVECSPCYQRTCPIDFRCMKKIEEQDVYGHIIAAIGRKKNKLSIRS